MDGSTAALQEAMQKIIGSERRNVSGVFVLQNTRDIHPAQIWRIAGHRMVSRCSRPFCEEIAVVNHRLSRLGGKGMVIAMSA
jgi:hypothetical protein